MMRRILLFVFLIGCSFNTSAEIGGDYLGAKYVSDPLGEAHAPDTDPLIRFDAFDCTTFVETSLAKGDVNRLNEIRYQGEKTDFIHRNHFIETDWLKNNSNLVRNVSAHYAPTAVRTVTIDKKNWFKVKHNTNTNFVSQTTELEYIPYEHAKSIKVSEPVVVLFVINNPYIHDKIGTDLAIRHMGFLLPGGILRHASRISGKVVDTNFDKYINRIMENQNNLGIMILEIKK